MYSGNCLIRTSKVSRRATCDKLQLASCGVKALALSRAGTTTRKYLSQASVLVFQKT